MHDPGSGTAESVEFCKVRFSGAVPPAPVFRLAVDAANAGLIVKRKAGSPAVFNVPKESPAPGTSRLDVSSVTIPITDASPSGVPIALY